MSAIAGIFNQNGSPVEEEELRAMTAVLAPFGGRSETFWRSENVGFGHRLSWLTKEDEFENQPVTSRDGRFTLITAARIDNRPELCASLGIAPAESGSMPDSALIMAAFEKWGEASLSRLVGSFALAVYSSREGSLLLARDPAGQRALYYWTNGRRFAFASAPGSLFQLPFIPRTLNLQRLAEHLVLMPRVFGSPSWYQGVASVEPGHAVVVDRARSRSLSFWSPYPHHEIRYACDSDYVEAFNELWERVVGSQMRSRTGVGILLSGGLDSTAIAAVAAPYLSLHGKRLAAFTDVPPADFAGPVAVGRYVDETPYVQAMARKFPNIDLNFITTQGRFFLDGIEEYFRAAEAPGRSGYNLLWFNMICRSAATQDVRVLLTGQAGNLTISWYGSHLMGQLLGGGRWLTAWSEARALVRTGIARSVPAALAQGALPLLPGPVWSALMRVRYRDNPVYSSSFSSIARFLISPEFASEQRIAERAREVRHDFRPRPHPDMRNQILGPATGEGEGYGALENRFGVELRSPAADPRVAEFCLSIPEDQFLRNGTGRWLIRRAMKDRLPEAILNNSLRGAQSVGWRDSLGVGSSRLAEELDAAEGSPLARQAIDLTRLRALIGRFGASNDRSSSLDGTIAGLTVMTARFLRWIETGT